MQSSPASFDLPLEPLVTRTPQFQAFLPNDPEGSHNEGVGENNNLTDIMVDFDTLGQPNTFQRIVQRPNLQLTDLNVLHQRHQQQLIQSWDNTSSPMHSPSSRYSPGTPGFFTPGFLESLQEDEVYDHRIGIDWNTNTPPQPSNEAMEYNAMISPEKNLVAQSGEGVTFFTSSSPTDHALLGKEKTANRRACMGAPNNRMLQLSANAARIKPLVQTYLANSVSQEAATRLGEKTVIILTSKVAQKSYGTEKRFLCPPPTTILVGTGWWTAKDKVDSMGNEVLRVSGLDKDIILAPPKLTVSISGETSTQAGQIEWYTVSGATVGQTGQIKSTSSQGKENSSRFRSSESRHPPVDMYHNHQQEPLAAGKCVSKHLYINDADEKRKRVECLARLQLANGLQLGTLASKAIKVISKPSKKRQSVKNMELCIHHGTTVSLFNRIRSQTVSTKYLGVSTSEGTPLAFPGLSLQANTSSDGTCFVARTTSWDPFIIWIVDTSRSPGEPVEESDTPEDYIGLNVLSRSTPYPPPPAIALKNKTSQLIPIHYNQHIVLQCLTTGLVSPVMVIRKVDRASTVVGGARCTDDLTGGGGEFGDEVLGDPVSQLHKIALQIVQDPSSAQQQSLQDMMMPRTSQPVTYLACLNDMVGMHKTTEGRKPVTGSVTKPLNSQAWDENFSNDLFDITSQEGEAHVVHVPL
ncbi:hypothetical protein RMCBS344292_02842 [Rhizopus microsporus]|nr:hypothetical protein RMCBS344292_02842 [Rhizopus microsporus]